MPAMLLRCGKEIKSIAGMARAYNSAGEASRARMAPTESSESGYASMTFPMSLPPCTRASSSVA